MLVIGGYGCDFGGVGGAAIDCGAWRGVRYRSLGNEDITHPVASEASTLQQIIAELETTKVAERSGRAMDHEAEDAFERLRAAGYM
jgi:sulfate adenylyltransferase subunit 2